MEWISFILDNEKKLRFETVLMPNLIKSYNSLLEMSGSTWAAYYERTGFDSYRCLFCSDSPLLIKFVKDFAEKHTMHFIAPNTIEMEHFGHKNLLEKTTLKSEK